MRKLYIRTSNRNDHKEIVEKINTTLSDYKIKLGKIHSQKKLPHWDKMPSFEQIKQDPYSLIEYTTFSDNNTLSLLLNQNITDKTKSVWYPKLVKRERGYWTSKSNIQPQFPIYIISKSRPRCMTSEALDKMGVDYKIVIEPVDYDAYKAFHSDDKLIQTPFSDLGQGSIPVRNFVRKLSISNGDKWHWIMDDNIEDFNVLYKNTKDVARTASIFRYAEDFVLLHSNVGQAGFNYYSFCKATDPVPPYYVNTRIYSCILMNNDVDFEWRGRYNEDTDLSLRILKAGYCTILFNMFMAGKVTTLRMKGGNTDHVYTDGDDRLKFAESLRDQHPDVVEVVRKFNRWHHKVDYSGFKQKLIRDKEPDYDYINDLTWNK